MTNNRKHNLDKELVESLFGSKGESLKEHWKWRYRAVEKIAENLDLDYFGVEAMYLIGSTKNCDAGPYSDIDIMFHFKGNENQKKELVSRIEDWSRELAEINYLKTGVKVDDGLIDIHIITDEDIENKDSFASMIGAVNNRARLIKN